MILLRRMVNKYIIYPSTDYKLWQMRKTIGRIKHEASFYELLNKKKTMNLEKLLNRKREFKVIANTTNPNNESLNKMIGGIYEFKGENVKDEKISLQDEEEEILCWLLKKKDLQEVTPLKDVNGERICVGDWIENRFNDKYLIYDTLWFGREWKIVATENEDFKNYRSLEQESLNKGEYKIIKSEKQKLQTKIDELKKKVKELEEEANKLS